MLTDCRKASPVPRLLHSSAEEDHKHCGAPEDSRGTCLHVVHSHLVVARTRGNNAVPCNRAKQDTLAAAGWFEHKGAAGGVRARACTAAQRVQELRTPSTCVWHVAHAEYVRAVPGVQDSAAAQRVCVPDAHTRVIAAAQQHIT